MEEYGLTAPYFYQRCRLNNESRYRFLHLPSYGKNTNVANGKWTVFFIACGKDNILPAFLLDMFYSYWKNHQQIVTYLFFDYLVSIAYENIPAITEMVDSVPLQRISNLSKCLNMPFNENLWRNLVQTMVSTN